MSGPPRSKIQMTVYPVGPQFSICLADFLPEEYPDEDGTWVINWLERFIRDHRSELNSVPRPSGYMIAKWSKAFPSGKEIPDVRCKDPVLAVAVLGRLAGDIYIPRREISFSNSYYGWEKSAYQFPAKYFPQYCGGRGATTLPGEGRARSPSAPQFGGFIETALPDDSRARTPSVPQGGDK